MNEVAGGFSNLKSRILVAILGLAVIGALFYRFQAVGVAIFVFVISLCMQAEFLKMLFRLSDQKQKFRFSFFISVIFAAVSVFWRPWMTDQNLVFTFLISATCVFFLLTAKSQELFHSHLQEMAAAIFGMIYFLYIPSFISRLTDFPQGMNWILLFLVLNWVSDIGAYFFGIRFGKAKLYSAVSPGKTWAGVFGGWSVAMVLSLLFCWRFMHGISLTFAVVISTAVVLAAILGDLFESFIKRALNKKDSGTLLPGHGGFMDRFDGMVMSAPVMYYGVKYLLPFFGSLV